MTAKQERKINRIKSIYLYIKSTGQAKTEEIAEEFGYSVRTVQLDLRFLCQKKAIKTVKGVWYLNKAS